MPAKGRREQVFDACNHLYSKGFREKYQFTYRAMHDACEILGYPRGHQGTLIKYRDEWLDANLSEAKSQEIGSHEAESPLLQSALDALLKEHKSKVETELKAEYEEKYLLLESEKNALHSKLEETEETLIDTEHQLTQSHDKYTALDTHFKAVLEENKRFSDDKASLRGELEAAKAALNEAKLQFDSKIKTIVEDNKALVNSKADLIDKLEQQLASQEATHQQMLDEVKSAAELRYQDVFKRNEKLEHRIKEVEGDYQSMKTDFSRQEQTINLFERERGEFYQEFTVIRKKFEQVGRLQEIAKGQEKIVKQLEVLAKKSSKFSSKK